MRIMGVFIVLFLETIHSKGYSHSAYPFAVICDKFY